MEMHAATLLSGTDWSTALLSELMEGASAWAIRPHAVTSFFGTAWPVALLLELVGVALVHAMADDAEIIVSEAQILEDEVEAKQSSAVEYLRRGSSRTKRLGVLLSVARKANCRVVRTSKPNSEPANVL
jgi:hypothetical protein